MHARTVDTENRFGHEGSHQTVLGGNRFYSIFHGEHIVSSFECIRKAEIDLMLAQGNFMMAYLNFQPHFIQGDPSIRCAHAQHHHPVKNRSTHPHHGAQDEHCHWSPEQEEFGFWTNIVCPAFISQPFQDSLEGTTRVLGIRHPIGV